MHTSLLKEDLIQLKKIETASPTAPVTALRISIWGRHV
jgi:hypothetical protein